MFIPFDKEIKPIKTVVRLKDGLLNWDNRSWMAWCYCGFRKNEISGHQPYIGVGFREYSNRMISSEIRLTDILLTNLGQVRIGTIWQNNKCIAEAIYPFEKFAVNFSLGSWRITSFAEASQYGFGNPYPQEIYRLLYEEDRNYFLEFPLQSTGGRLIIPCIEFFTRCYGRSEEVKRILSTYPWTGGRESAEGRILASINEIEEEGLWKVNLGKKLLNDDVVLIAHIKYDKYSKTQAKSIYAQLESFYEQRNRYSFIKVAPWFQGPAILGVRGIWFENNRSFLALRVIGCSDPGGVPIELDRENTSNTELPSTNEEPGKAWAGSYYRNLEKTPEIIDLTDYNDPDHNSSGVDILDNDFVIYGKKRAVISKKYDRATGSVGKRKVDISASSFSSGDPFGSMKGVGFASIHAQPVMESSGVMRDLWNAISYLRIKYPKAIQSVNTFTFKDGFINSDEPRLIALQPFGLKEKIASGVRTWPFLDIIGEKRRGLLVVRLVINEIAVYFVEIQRRSKKIKTDACGIIEKEEPYQGLVFTLNNQNNFENWVKRLTRDIRLVRGIMKKLARYCPGNAASYKHVSSKKYMQPGLSTIVNALNKMNIKLEE
jgi:hypothetical protein